MESYERKCPASADLVFPATVLGLATCHTYSGSRLALAVVTA